MVYTVWTSGRIRNINYNGHVFVVEYVYAQLTFLILPFLIYPIFMSLWSYNIIMMFKQLIAVYMH